MNLESFLKLVLILVTNALFVVFVFSVIGQIYLLKFNLYFLAGLAAVVTVTVWLRIYIRGAQFKSKVRADGKNVIVTGANSGIGLATTKLLCLRGAHVHMLCRNIQKAEEARTILIKDGCDPALLTVHFIDLCDFKTVRAFAKKFSAEIGVLDILICNAGIMGIYNFTKTIDGHEITYQANFLSHHLLSELLYPLLHKSTDGRILNVSSIVHTIVKNVSLKQVNDSATYVKGGVHSYANSKLAQMMSTIGLAPEWSDIKIIACHPGNVNTNIFKKGILSFLQYTWLRPVVAFVLKSEEDGAQTPLFCALNKEINSGAYYHECRDVNNTSKLNPICRNGAEIDRLLEETRICLGIE